MGKKIREEMEKKSVSLVDGEVESGVEKEKEKMILDMIEKLEEYGLKK